MQEELQALNLSYLLLAQRFLDQDRESAMLQLSLNSDVAEFISSLSGMELARLARVNQCLFRLRFEKASKLESLLQNKRSENMVQIHAALLLASDSPTA